MLSIELCERGWVPDMAARMGIRTLIAARLRRERRGGGEAEFAAHRAMLAQMRQGPIALATSQANEQHYDLPASFFENVLGPDLKYSACYWDQHTTELEHAESTMLALTCHRAGIANGQRVLDLGCGWGSLSLWIARHFPNSRVTAVSNSLSQGRYIAAKAARQGLPNVEIVTADMNAFAAQGTYDRIISVEMFEHMRNYEALMHRIAGWLGLGGKLFIQVFCHSRLLYAFETDGAYDWMGRHFFTGGLMPAEQTLAHFQNDLHLRAHWRLSGIHYQRTAEAWLRRFDQHRVQVMPILAGVYGAAHARRRLNRWRLFFLACAELFGYRQGTEWLVAHYLFEKPRAGDSRSAHDGDEPWAW